MNKNIMKRAGVISVIVLTFSFIVSILIITPNAVKGFTINMNLTINGPFRGYYYGNLITVYPGCSASLVSPPNCLESRVSSRGGLGTGSGTGWTPICIRYEITEACTPPPPPPPNQAPTVTYSSTTNINYNTATSNWSYGDPEGDPQSLSRIQVATDPGFTNIIYNVTQSGAGTSMAISGLIPGITYYPRVQAYNAINGWTGWSNGVAFTTLANNPPNLGEFSCSGTTTGYTSARVNWNYTGSDPDPLELTLKYIRVGSPSWTSVSLPGNRTGVSNIVSLTPGDTYAVRIEVVDQYNRHLRNNWAVTWKDCGTVTPSPYPEPIVNYNLTGGGNTANSGGTLTVNTGEEIRVNWGITNTDGVDLSTCRITTSGPQQIFNISPLTSFSGGISNTPVPDPTDQNYTVRLTCAGRTPANPVRNIDRTINLTVRSRPIISCTVRNTVVSKETPILNISGTVSNINRPYEWWISKNGDIASNYTPTGIRGNTLNRQLNYQTDTFGKYTPWLQIRENNGRTTSQSCREITNFGDRTIREVSP